MGNYLQKLEDKSISNLFEHQEYFIISEFNQKYLQGLNQSQIDQFYSSFDFSNYVKHKKAENQINVELLKIINQKWIYQTPQIILLIKKAFFTFYYFEQGFQNNLTEYKSCIQVDRQQECIQSLNNRQLILYSDMLEKLKITQQKDTKQE